MFKGESLQLGEQEYVIPPLSLEKLEELEDRFHALSAPAAGFSERLQQLMPILLASFQRNYPEITEAELRSQLDLPSLNQLLQIIMAANGFTTEAQQSSSRPSAVGRRQNPPAVGTGPEASATHSTVFGREPTAEDRQPPGELVPAKE